MLLQTCSELCKRQDEMGMFQGTVTSEIEQLMDSITEWLQYDLLLVSLPLSLSLALCDSEVPCNQSVIARVGWILRLRLGCC